MNFWDVKMKDWFQVHGMCFQEHITSLKNVLCQVPHAIVVFRRCRYFFLSSLTCCCIDGLHHSFKAMKSREPCLILSMGLTL